MTYRLAFRNAAKCQKMLNNNIDINRDADDNINKSKRRYLCPIVPRRKELKGRMEVWPTAYLDLVQLPIQCIYETGLQVKDVQIFYLLPLSLHGQAYQTI